MYRHNRGRHLAAGVAWFGALSSTAGWAIEPTAVPSDVAPHEAHEVSAVSPEDMQALEASMEAERAPHATGAGTVSLDISLILDVAGAWFSDLEPLQLGAHDPLTSGFTFRLLEMSLGASVDPYFRFDANLAFTLEGVEIEEAYASTLALPANLKVRAGQFLTKFGRLNPRHPHAWSFVDQALVNGKFFGGDGSRAVGAEVSWLSPLPWYLDVTAAANMPSTQSFYAGEEIPLRSAADLLYSGRIEQFFGLTDSLSLLWGLSAQFGPNARGRTNRTQIYGSDLYLRLADVNSASHRTLGLQLEGMFRRRMFGGVLYEDGGGRAELIGTLSPRWETGARYEMVTGVPGDPLDPEWTSERQRITAQVTFYPTHFSQLRLQSSVDLPEWRDEPIYGAMLNLEVLAGAHTAHQY